MKDALELNKVVLLGRTLDEYRRYFGLAPEQWRGRKVLDIASGVSSFCAEANEQGLETTAFDPIYDLPPETIRAKCEPDLDFVVAEIGRVKAYRWDFYKSPEGMRVYRERAYRKFLVDYEKERGRRYVSGMLPHLPFAAQQFDLSLVSYLMFVYDQQEHFDYEFHRRSLLEIMRVTSGEARIYPLVNFRAERCRFVDRVKEDPELKQFTFSEVKTDFEFLANSNSFLQIRRKS